MITPPEDRISGGKEQHAVNMEPKNPYDQARTYVEGFKLWDKNMASSPPDYYEEPLSIKMSTKDWIELSDELNIFGTDEKSTASS